MNILFITPSHKQYCSIVYIMETTSLVLGGTSLSIACLYIVEKIWKFVSRSNCVLKLQSEDGSQVVIRRSSVDSSVDPRRTPRDRRRNSTGGMVDAMEEERRSSIDETELKN